jgi:hypothetical protein
MESGADWVVRPVLRKMCGYESLLDGTLSLDDVAEMNDALDCMEENERRYRVWRKHHPELD